MPFQKQIKVYSKWETSHKQKRGSSEWPFETMPTCLQTGQASRNICNPSCALHRNAAGWYATMQSRLFITTVNNTARGNASPTPALTIDAKCGKSQYTVMLLHFVLRRHTARQWRCSEPRRRTMGKAETAHLTWAPEATVSSLKLNPWKRKPEKLTAAQLGKRFPTFTKSERLLQH
jgi:hypothetical protein